MAKYLASIPELYTSYKNWVSANPQVIGDVETTVKWMSYLIAGRITSSAAISELIYSLSNLLVLFNDEILLKSRNIGGDNDGQSSTDTEHKLKLFMTTLEYCEVFIEYSAIRLWGEKGRWAMIVIVQLVKFVGRLVLTKIFNNPFVQNPPIQTIDRKRLDVKKNQTVDEFGNSGTFTFTLKRSGRVVRKVEGAPPMYLRNWKELQSGGSGDGADGIVPMPSPNEEMNKIAELLYICKPLVHLGGVATFGYKNWKSYAIALAIDLISLRMFYTNRQSLTKEQRLEISRRCVSLLLYLMRSPFYDRHSGDRITGLVESISKNIPIARAICNPILSYIPQWQSTYFYMWST